MKSKKRKYQKPELKTRKIKTNNFLIKYNPNEYDLLAGPVIFPPVGSG